MQDYIFRSRSEDNQFLEDAIMGKRVLTAYERALEAGKSEGKLEKAIETARKMKEEGFHLEQILRITGLSLEDLEKHGLV